MDVGPGCKKEWSVCMGGVHFYSGGTPGTYIGWRATGGKHAENLTVQNANTHGWLASTSKHSASDHATSLYAVAVSLLQLLLSPKLCASCVCLATDCGQSATYACALGLLTAYTVHHFTAASARRMQAGWLAGLLALFLLAQSSSYLPQMFICAELLI